MDQLSPFPVLFTSFLFAVILLKLWRKSKTKNPNLPPGPKRLPIIGNMHQLVGYPLPHHRMRDLAKEYGSVMLLQLGEISTVVISSAEAGKEVLKAHDIIFAQRPFLLAASILTQNFKDIAFAPYGDYWRQLRKICVLELLSSKRVQSFRSVREEEVSNLIRTISNNAGYPFNLSQNMVSLTYGIVARISFGKKYKEQDRFIEVNHHLIEMAGGFSIEDAFPSLKFIQEVTGMGSRLREYSAEAEEILRFIIDDHRAKRKAANDGSVGTETHDLVDVLLNLQEKGDLEFPMETENIIAVILDVFVAGSETSSRTVEWAMSEMLKSPRVMRKAQAEVRKVFDKKGKVDEEGLQELEYLKLVIKETLRLHPPAALLLPRESRERCEINGYEIPAKCQVHVNAWAIGRDLQYWTDPETFFPERFQDTSIDFKGANFEFIPFGAGRRMCPGMIFALPNLELPLANFLYHFDWKLPGGQKLETLDMTELFGATIKRKNELIVIPIPYHPSLVESSL